MLATEPCLQSPCEDSSGSLVRSKCVEAATWVAVGAVSNVVHHPEGPPLSKDFAEFTFTARRWEKGKGQAGQRYRFRVGWCDNQQELPKGHDRAVSCLRHVTGRPGRAPLPLPGASDFETAVAFAQCDWGSAREAWPKTYFQPFGVRT